MRVAEKNTRPRVSFEDTDARARAFSCGRGTLKVSSRATALSLGDREDSSLRGGCGGGLITRCSRGAKRNGRVYPPLADPHGARQRDYRFITCVANKSRYRALLDSTADPPPVAGSASLMTDRHSRRDPSRSASRAARRAIFCDFAFRRTYVAFAARNIDSHRRRCCRSCPRAAAPRSCSPRDRFAAACPR